MDNNASTSNHSLGMEDDKSVLAVMGILSFFSVLGTAGNAMVLYVYVRKRHKLASTIFIISLAGTDFITCLIIIPYTIAVEYLEYFLEYDVLCKLYMFFITSNVPFAAFIMVAIAFDRYLCICHPFMHLMNAKRARMIIFLLACFAVLLGLITSLNYGVYLLETIDPCFNETDLNVITTNENNSLKYLTSYTGVNTFTNKTSSTLIESRRQKHCPTLVRKYTGFCEPNNEIFSSEFIYKYQKVYAAFFLIALIAVAILYALVYRSVLIRRAKRRKQRRSTRSISLQKDSWFSEKRPSIPSHKHSLENGTATERHPETELARQLTIRERGIVANIRTAAMLFVVTAVFIFSFLPSWLMAHRLIPYHIVIFYMYFVYNVANPIIYAFMNKAFRRDLRDVFDCKAILRDFPRA